MNTSTNDLFDLSYLNQLFQGNSTMINSIIELFLQQVPSYIDEMEDSINLKNYQALHPLAHKAKSSIAMLGLKKMEKIILEIEYKSKHQIDVENLPALVEAVRVESDLVYGGLQKVLTNSAA